MSLDLLVLELLGRRAHPGGRRRCHPQKVDGAVGAYRFSLVPGRAESGRGQLAMQRQKQSGEQMAGAERRAWGARARVIYRHVWAREGDGRVPSGSARG